MPKVTVRANNYSIDTLGIATAMKKSAAAFNASNTSLDKSLALIVATNDVLQNPETTGTLWNTLSARIRGENRIAHLQRRLETAMRNKAA